MNELLLASTLLLWIIVVIMAFLMVGMLRQLGLMQARLGPEPGALITPEGLERGTEAPDFDGLELSTQKQFHFHDLRGRRVLLTFLQTTCGPCRELIPHLNEIAHGYRGQVEVLAICQGSNEGACAEFAHQHKLRTKLLADPNNFVGANYYVKSTPLAYLIDENGIVLIRGVVNHLSHLEALLKEEGTWQADKPWQMVIEPAETAANIRRIPKDVGTLLPK